MIKASDAREALSKKRSIRKETYKAILEGFMRKIRLAIEKSQTQVMLEVPVMVPGLPSYDRDEATSYLERQLRLLGYQSQAVAQWVIHVSWGKPSAEPEELVPSFSNAQRLAEELRRKNQRK